MPYKIVNGVTPPERKIVRPSYYDNMMDAIAKLEVDDKHSCVRVEFSEVSEISKACARIYGDNKRHPAWRYTVIADKEAKAIYVMKVSEQKVNGNGHHK